MEQEPHPDDWLAALQDRGMGPALHLLLDVLAPLGALGAQLLYVAQPLAGVFGWRERLGHIADALEQPGGMDALRRRLDEHDEGP